MNYRGDEVLYPNPGYPIYESQIEFHGGKGPAVFYSRGQRAIMKIDIAAIERLITPKTKLMIVNDLQNPTGAEAGPGRTYTQSPGQYRHREQNLDGATPTRRILKSATAGKAASLVSLPGMEERSPAALHVLQEIRHDRLAARRIGRP